VRRHLSRGRAEPQAGVHLDLANSTPERESLVTITFRATPGGTELVFLHEQFFDETVRDDHQRGWSGSFDKLERFLAG